MKRREVIRLLGAFVEDYELAVREGWDTGLDAFLDETLGQALDELVEGAGLTLNDDEE